MQLPPQHHIVGTKFPTSNSVESVKIMPLMLPWIANTEEMADPVFVESSYKHCYAEFRVLKPQIKLVIRTLPQ